MSPWGGRRGGYRQDSWGSGWNDNSGYNSSNNNYSSNNSSSSYNNRNSGGYNNSNSYNNRNTYTNSNNYSNSHPYNNNSGYNTRNGYNNSSSSNNYNNYNNSNNNNSSNNNYNNYHSSSSSQSRPQPIGAPRDTRATPTTTTAATAATAAAATTATTATAKAEEVEEAEATAAAGAAAATAKDEEEWNCPLCCKYLGNKTLPFLEAVLVRTSDDVELTRRCHFECLLKNFPSAKSTKYRLSTAFADSFKLILEYSPRLKEKATQLRICFEEDHLSRAAEGVVPIKFPQPSVPPPPPISFKFEGLVEVRISGCDTLRTLPPEVGNMRKLRSMVLISNNLQYLPDELGKLTDIENLFLNGNFLRRLPETLSDMRKLKEVCFDANQLEEIPPIRSEKLILLTAPGNKLRSIPATGARLLRIELHGNNIDDANMNAPDGMTADWSKLTTLKMMGNQLPMVPPQIDQMKALQIVALAGNRITELPDCLADMRWLEWVYVYDNQITKVPSRFISRNKRLSRVLLEANPLPKEVVEELIADAGGSENLRTLGLDYRQVEAVENPEAVPAVALGTVIPVPGRGQYWMKLYKDPEKQDQKSLLIVAFSASQGEPEWMGLMRKLRSESAVARPLPNNSETLSQLFEVHGAESDDDKLAALWAECCVGSAKSPPSDRESMPVPDFDVLSVVDHRMRWYSEDAENFGQTLQNVARDYSRVLFLGASMGGFGSLLHSGDIADAVVAFSPQANLCEACLRPPAESRPALETLCTRMMASAQRATSRGASLTVHCAADEHFLHALSLPQGSVNVVVHPMVPRKPFARILDGGGVLMPIVQDAVWRVLQQPSTREKEPILGNDASSEGITLQPSIGSSADATLSVASWIGSGDLKRHASTPLQALSLLIKEEGPPRPGDWFCKRCRKRNMSLHFFCWSCPIEAQSHMAVEGTPKIPENHSYPQSGDWGCANCREANCSFQKKCPKCWELKTSNKANYVHP